MAIERRSEDVRVSLLEAKVDSHLDMCTLRYEAINARLKRLEAVLLATAGAIIVLLINIALKVH